MPETREIENGLGDDGSTEEHPHGEDVIFYLTVYNEPVLQPAEPEGLSVEALLKGIYRFSEGPALGDFVDEDGSLAAGLDTGDIQLRMAKSDWSAFDESDDHSRTTATAYTDAPAVPAAVLGGLLRKEFEKLDAWIRDEPLPDIITLPNSLLISLAAPLKRAFNRPVLCTLQGEELFLEGLTSRYRERALAMIREQVGVSGNAFLAEHSLPGAV